MMENISWYLSLLFISTTLGTIYLLCRALPSTQNTIRILVVWLCLQSVVALSGFYTNTTSLPPRFLGMVVPPAVLFIVLFTSKKGKEFIDQIYLSSLILLHVIRIPVEIVLYGLSIENVIPELMTFDGRNWDIFSGITAPFIYYGYRQSKISNSIVLIWNFVCLFLLLNIVLHAVLSAPSPFQQFAFDQPNIAIFYFPFNWLPACVVPIVLFAHLVAIRKLIK
ncbi:MAG: hypothetical protein MUE33_03465 [Cytophagaceae bacterium]|nr:hypothetical protein [Cytophagaceae bacterium]